MQRLGLSFRKSALKLQDHILDQNNFGHRETNLLEFSVYRGINSAKNLCGLAERCLAAESCVSLLASLRRLEPQIARAISRHATVAKSQRPSQTGLASNSSTTAGSAGGAGVVAPPTRTQSQESHQILKEFFEAQELHLFQLQKIMHYFV